MTHKKCIDPTAARHFIAHYQNLLESIPLAKPKGNVVTQLAAARDAIRILSWFKSNAPQTQVIVLANKVQPTAMLEIKSLTKVPVRWKRCASETTRRISSSGLSAEAMRSWNQVR